MAFIRLVSEAITKIVGDNTVWLVWVYFLLLSLFVIRFIGLFIYHYAKVVKDSTYGEAIIYMNETFSSVHCLRRKNAFSDNEEFGALLIQFCDNLKKLYDKKTRAECSISIKAVKADKTDEVHNLCRDSKHEKSRNTVSYNNINHKISQNTAFNKICNSIINNDLDNAFYVNSSISKSRDYETTSRGAYYEGKLPYESELVVPIIPIKKAGSANEPLGGFICIDCNKKYEFDVKYDKALLIGIADGIYDLFIARNSQQKNQTYEATQEGTR